MKKLLIVDGMNLHFQMFFGMPAKIVNSNGKAIQGTLGFVGALIKMIKQLQPSHVVVLFDSEQQNARSEILPEYKANRPSFENVAEEHNPFSQLGDVYSALSFLQIKHTEVKHVETDDIIASYVLKFAKEFEIVICSFDSDFFQLINSNVAVFRYRGKNSYMIDEAAIKEKFTIKPSQYADFKSLTGDAADNIKGAKGIGPKTAAALINEFGSLQEIINNADRIEKKSARESVIIASEQLIKNKKIIELCKMEQIPFEIDELKYTYQNQTTTEVLNGIGLK